MGGPSARGPSLLPVSLIDPAQEDAFAERVLAQLHKRELISDEDVAQILSQDHTGFGAWLGDPFHDKESEQFVARYIERAPLSLEKLSIQHDNV